MGKDFRNISENYQKMYEQMRYIRNNLPAQEIYNQVMEECSELIQACSKCIRYLNKINPPRKTEEELKADLDEEIADVYVSISVLKKYINMNKVLQKTDRWYKVVKKLEVNND